MQMIKASFSSFWGEAEPTISLLTMGRGAVFLGREGRNTNTSQSSARVLLYNLPLFASVHRIKKGSVLPGRAAESSPALGALRLLS